MAKIISVAYGQNLVSTFYFVKDFFSHVLDKITYLLSPEGISCAI